MKEHDVFSMSDLDDSSVEEIAEKVNALTDSDKDRIFAECMSKMNIDVNSASERKIEVKRSSKKRFLPVLSTAACIIIIAGVLLKIGYSNGFKSESKDLSYNNTAPMMKDDDAVGNGASFDGFSDQAESADPVDRDGYESEDSQAAEENGASESEYDYKEVFEQLMDKFDLANAVVSNDPFEHESDYMYEKTDEDAVYQYYRITDSRISTVSDVENIVKDVFSEGYYTSMCQNLTEGEYPVYEENEDGLFTRAAARGWEFEWTDEEPEITDCTEYSFTARKQSMFWGQDTVMFEFRIVREEDGWKIESYSKDIDQ